MEEDMGMVGISLVPMHMYRQGELLSDYSMKNIESRGEHCVKCDVEARL